MEDAQLTFAEGIKKLHLSATECSKCLPRIFEDQSSNPQSPHKYQVGGVAHMQFQFLKGGGGIPGASWATPVSVRSPALVSKLESMEEDCWAQPLAPCTRAHTQAPIPLCPHRCKHMHATHTYKAERKRNQSVSCLTECGLYIVVLQFSNPVSLERL